MRNLDRCMALPTRPPRGQTAGVRPDWLRSQPVRLLVFLWLIVGLSGNAHAKGKPKTWAPPIPAGRAAITLAIRTVTAANGKVPAKVMWGRRLLGETPLNLQWPADSGPVDIVVLAQGYVPVHTRLYTFADDRIVVKLVDDEGKKALFGYKREVPAPPGASSAPQGAAAVPSTSAPSGTSPPAATPPPVATTPPAAPVVPSPPAGTP